MDHNSWSVSTTTTTTRRVTFRFFGKNKKRNMKYPWKGKKHLRIFCITIPTIDTKDFFLIDVTTTGIQILCFAVFTTVSRSVHGTVGLTAIAKVLRIMESIFQSRNAFPTMVTFMVVITGIEFLIAFDTCPSIY